MAHMRAQGQHGLCRMASRDPRGVHGISGGKSMVVKESSAWSAHWRPERYMRSLGTAWDTWGVHLCMGSPRWHDIPCECVGPLQIE